MNHRERRAWTTAEDDALRAAVLKEDPQSHPPTKWHAISKHVPTRTNKDCRKRYFAKMASVVAKGGWSNDEDERLIRAVEKYGTKWSMVAAVVESRNNDQCAKRWSDTLNPAIDRTPWTNDEDERLMQAVKEYGKHWTQIVRTHFVGRTGLSAKNRYSRITRMANQESNASRTVRRRAPTRAPYSMTMRASSPATNFDDQEYSPGYSSPLPEFSQAASMPTSFNRLTANTITSLDYCPSSVEEWRRLNNRIPGRSYRTVPEPSYRTVPEPSYRTVPEPYNVGREDHRFKPEQLVRWEPKPEPQDLTPHFTPPFTPEAFTSSPLPGSSTQYFPPANVGSGSGGGGYPSDVHGSVPSMDGFPPLRGRRGSVFPGLWDEQQQPVPKFEEATSAPISYGHQMSHHHLETTSEWSSPMSVASADVPNIRGHNDSYATDCYETTCSQTDWMSERQNHAQFTTSNMPSASSVHGFWSPPPERLSRLRQPHEFNNTY